ncbi:hypothetical protein A2W14_02350 [Candidatus Gottesmanbacteria bacterium RBG_16_37_8]|uniref:Aminotransferase class I/classII large domain-containing protein n=1 Tax=Candidatus Gottesmanbacteria bacterium RBG_16_37_8 TaxID=1798371 RepID=A0A1F5YTB1_9BACT|nr:MAG: hypothetical protein A2W14_02350 [Candidatus Gottesmanbacteria bacterium RBG_16_37_8]
MQKYNFMPDLRESHLAPVSFDNPEIRAVPTQKFPPNNLLDLITYTRLHSEIRSLAGGMPASELHPRVDIQNAINEVLSDPNIPPDEIFQYGNARGNYRYREVVADNLTKVTETELTPDHVITTVGGQDAISKFLEATFGPGNPERKVLLTRPDTYSALMGAAERFNIQVVGVLSDHEGIIPEELEKTIITLLDDYQVTPAGIFEMVLSNPTGGVMSDKRGLELSKICEKYGLNAYFDYAYFGIIFDENIEEPKLLYLDSKGITVGFSSSKIIAPGLRTTHLITKDDELMDKYVAIKRDEKIFTPPILELALWKLFSNQEWMKQRLATVKKRYLVGKETAVEAINQNSDVLKISINPQGGMFLYPEMPPGFSSHRLLERLLTEAKIALVPGSWTQTHQLQMADGNLIGPPMKDNNFRLCYSTLPPNELKEVISELAIFLRKVAKEENIQLFN